jgi:conjugal transfer pilus assembly protein TraB
MVQAVIDDKKPKALEDSKKKQIYLPPSFMEATLLSGVAAPTTSAAKSNPLPLLFRVKDLAVLPNRVKADLKGCFIIGSAVGNLADERVHIRLNTLSCVAKNGDAVIDQAVKGFVVDEDGKVGLKGRVVAKMGIHIARTALAGFIGGMGGALSSSMQTNSLNALGQTQSQLTDTDGGSIAKAGLGEGISSATKELQKFYLQLAEQTLPVIEIGSTKDVTVVISEGVGLEIMEKGKENETK